MLLNEFNGLKMEVGDITELQTFKQFKKIDIIVKFKYQNKYYLTAIEDKTCSKEHNQLITYNNVLHKKENKKVFSGVDDKNIARIFYKTDIDIESDKRACEDADPQWKYYFIEDIYKMFAGTEHTGCEIVDDYLDRIITVYKKCTIVPKDLSGCDQLEFRTYLMDLIKKNNWEFRDPQWYSYTSIIVDKRFADKHLFFSLEIKAYDSKTTEGFTVAVRGYNYKMEEDTKGNPKQTDIQLSKDDKAKCREVFLSCKDKNNNPIFKKSGSVESNDKSQKWALAALRKKQHDYLRYKINRDDVDKKLCEIVSAFLDACNKIYSML